MKSLFLIYPPLAKANEPPAGMARLAGFLRGHNATCTTYDANLHALHYLLSLTPAGNDTWTRRALKNRDRNLQALQQKSTYENFSRYQRAVADSNRLLSAVGEAYGLELTLANYQDHCSPLQSRELLQVAENYQANIFTPFYIEELLPQLLEQGPDYVGISIAYLSQAVASFALIGLLRHQLPSVQIILGGSLITSWMRSPFWQEPFSSLVDHCLAGPGEEPLARLLGVDKVPQGDLRPQFDQGGYLAPGFILPYAASTGCYWNKCLFCPETAEDNPYRPVATDKVLREVSSLCQRHEPSLIHFLDNAISPALMKGLAAQPPGPPWYGFARVSELLADVDFCHSLRASGCLMLKLGLESGDQQVLDNMGKGIDLVLVSQVLAALQAAGILTYVYLLFGTPSEDEHSARRTMAFTCDHHTEIGFVNLAIFNLPLASPEARDLVTSDFYEGDLSLYSNFHHPLGWSRRQIRTFLAREFKRQPAIAPIIQRDPPFFTSNHAAFFHPSFR